MEPPTDPVARAVWLARMSYSRGLLEPRADWFERRGLLGDASREQKLPRAYPADFIGPLRPNDELSPIPLAPPDVDIDENIAEASQHPYDVWWFRDQVHNKGKWDYKQRGHQYENFGNFHYGVVGAALGLPEWLLLREAGRAQQAAGSSKPEWGDPGLRFDP